MRSKLFAQQIRGNLLLRQRGLLVTALVTVLMMVITVANMLELSELNAIRLAFQLRGPQTPVSPVVIVAIDDNTFGNTRLQWPWPRTYLAQLVDALNASGARLIAFDVFLNEPEAVGQPATYTLQGESARDIATKYGLNEKQIIEANALDGAFTVCGGQTLTIPANPPTEHIVQRDRLEDIATRYQIDLTRLMELNNLTGPCSVKPSDLLLIPIQGPIAYTVQANDTVASLAALFQVNPLAVVDENGATAGDPLTAGQTLTVQFGDAALAASLQSAGNVILNGEVFKTVQNGNLIESLRQPLTILKTVAAGFGLTTVEPADDNTIHTIRAWDASQDNVYFAWPFVAASLYSGLPLDAAPTASQVMLGAVSVPLEHQFFRVNYRGPEGTIPTYSVLQVVNGDYAEFESEAFNGKVVFIGATTESLQDTHPTAFDGRNATPGVEIMANAFDTLISHQYLVRSPRWVAALLVLVAGVVAFGLASIRRTGLAVMILLSIMLAYIVAWYAAFVGLGWQLPLIAPEAGVFIAFVIPTLERAVSEELEKRRVRGIFEMFISPEMVGQLIEQGVEAMRGKRAELTILFSDIRGFTTMSEKLTPEELVNLLNEYLGVMTDVIHQHGGTVDKYEGDLVMAFFGAPIPHPDHAQRAVRASIDMRLELDRLRQKWEGEGKPAKLEMGIGLNTAEVFVGLVGSGRRVNYTVMGDGVNLASRLQDLTKDLKWPLLIGEATYAKVQNQFETEFGDSRLVKGKTVPVKIYKVLSEKGAPPEKRVRPLFE